MRLKSLEERVASTSTQHHGGMRPRLRTPPARQVVLGFFWANLHAVSVDWKVVDTVAKTV